MTSAEQRAPRAHSPERRTTNDENIPDFGKILKRFLGFYKEENTQINI
jgi:hypothetical protein